MIWALVAASCVSGLADAPLHASDEAARTRWEEKVVSLGNASSEEAFVAGVELIRGVVPHIRGEPISTGSFADTEHRRGTAVQLDSNWWAERTAPVAMENRFSPAPPIGPWIVRVIGFPEFRSMIEPDIYAGVLAIHNCPTPGDEPDPVNLIRAVNTLQAMGEADALRALEAYGNVCVANYRESWRELSEERIIWVARLLYVAPSTGPAIRPPILGGPSPIDMPELFGATFPIALQNDVPFFLVNGYSLMGCGEPAMDYLKVCRAGGTFRQQPLRPTADPIAAAERVLDSKAMHTFLQEPGKPALLDLIVPMIQKQAIEAAGVLLGDSREYTPPHIVDWKKATRVIEETPGVWDVKLQDFVRANGR